MLLVGFPEDLKNAVVIAKAILGFGILVHWHDTENLAWVVAKVYLNNDAKIPDFVKVNAGLPKKGRSWTIACFVLKEMKRLLLQWDLCTPNPHSPLIGWALYHLLVQMPPLQNPTMPPL